MSPLNESPSETENGNDVTNELNGDEKVSKRALILLCPEYRKTKILMQIRALEEGNTIFDLTPPPTILTNTETSQICKLRVP